MKHSVYLLLTLCLMSFCCQAYISKANANESNSTSVISSQYLDIIECADSIVWLLLDPMSEDTAAMRINDIAEILFEETDTVADRINALKSTLTYSESFVASDMVKESTFLPDVAVKFFSSKGTMTFSYSFYCDLCRFESEGKYQETDGELVRKSILQMVCEVFPKDRYLRQLKRRER